MAWIVLDLDNTLLLGDEMGQETPTAGAVEACMSWAQEGHRLTVYTSRFAPMPDSERNRLKEQIEMELQSYGFPPMEVWTGTTKPDADLFVGHNHITYDGDWGLVLAQAQTMMEELGLVPGPMPDAGGTLVEGNEAPPEEAPDAPDEI